MKCLFYDLRRAIVGHWFLAALLATTAALYMSIGQSTHELLNYLIDHEAYENPFWYTMSRLLVMGMKGDFGLLTLPALSALPFAAQALQEIRSGAIRPAVFRVGRINWVIGKTAGCLLSGVLLQGAAVVLLSLVLNGLMYAFTGQSIPWGENADIGFILLRRMICGGIWAGVGCIISLATEISSAAYLAPLCLCYALMMIGTRFFPQLPMINPMQWVSGLTWIPAIILLVITVLQAVFLKRGVQRYA